MWDAPVRQVLVGCTFRGVPAASLVRLTKTYFVGAFGKRGQPALRGVDLELPRGAAFGLIGLNGAGKTTLIKILLGIVRPTSGEVRLLDGDPLDPAVRARVGYLPERLHLPHSFTPKQFLASVARLKRVVDAAKEIDRQLERVGLSHAVGRKLGGFSKGMKQRAGLAAALLGAPDLLVLDEPSDGVDPIGRVDIRNILAEERERGATLLLNSHLLSETERVCDRAGILSDGLLVREGPLDELCGSAKSFRAVFASGADVDRLADIGFTRADDGFRCDADSPDALNARLERARAAGALLVELRPELSTLEDVLAHSLADAAADPEKA